MRGSWIAVVAGLAGLGAIVGGCILVTGGTDGYTQFDAGPPDVFAGCRAASDCMGDGSADAGDICCIGLTSSGLGTSCENSCFTIGTQLCATNAECVGDGGDGGGIRCVQQTCPLSVFGVTSTLGALPLEFGACGTGPQKGCSEGTASAPDSGTDSGPGDSGPGDAGTPDATAPDASDAGIDTGIPDASLDSAG